MLGQLQDAGNTTTLAHYLELLAGAGMLRGIPEFPGMEAFRKAFHPTRMLLVGGQGIPLEEFLSTPISHWFG